ncbi:glycosyltransferase family 2 protein [Ornithinimicrobium sp. F0845]|uniref:glycosyltransferase family 2 protein n=1 Tax=Ornithinimicrobium sp. F0845 TaxID=2926412 RepID=UPI001FF6FAAD|nr:glycosyltransferase family 2 protein [Ornithinimicrobium sp. F0845]MCK0111832.1 glycosyltransferase family 2 protein [Ornithinimicrobium sp. F0845]
MSLTPPDAGSVADGTAHHEPIEDAWLVIPLFNEASVLREVITEARKTFPHVVCVDDASTDGSGVAAREVGAAVVTHPFNLGQGAALQTGIDYVLQTTDAQYVVTFDADGQHRVEDAAAMVRRAREEDVAIVFGSRFLDGRTKPGLLRRIILKGAVWITNQQTGLRLSDAHNGLRVIRRDAAQGLHLAQNRMAHATEIVLQLSRTKLPWVEHPVLIVYTDYSRAKGQSLINSVNILIDTIIK